MALLLKKSNMIIKLSYVVSSIKKERIPFTEFVLYLITYTISNHANTSHYFLSVATWSINNTNYDFALKSVEKQQFAKLSSREVHPKHL